MNVFQLEQGSTPSPDPDFSARRAFRILLSDVRSLPARISDPFPFCDCTARQALKARTLSWQVEREASPLPVPYDVLVVPIEVQDGRDERDSTTRKIRGSYALKAEGFDGELQKIYNARRTFRTIMAMYQD